MGLAAAFGNPRFYWCYRDEDFMRVLKLIAEKSLAGTNATLVGMKIIEKILLGMVARLNFYGE